MPILDFLKEHWAVFASALLALSEVLALLPGVKSNSVVQLIIETIKKLLAQPKAP